MTFGHWLQETHDRLRAARDAMRLYPELSLGDGAALQIARRRLYDGLARLTELLTARRPSHVDIDRLRADLVLNGRGRPTSKFYLALHVAATVEPHGLIAVDGVSVDQLARRAELPVEAASAAVKHLLAAADAVATAGDILASHVPPRERAATPEGRAIRSRAGVPAALADVGRLAHGVLKFDARLPSWLGRRPVSDAESLAAYKPVIDAARWATGCGLRLIANELIHAAGSEPSLLRLLDIAPASGRPLLPDDSLHVATRALTSCRDWIFRNPGQVRAAHLAAGTQLGLAVAVLSREPEPASHAWRRAAIHAARLHSSPPRGDAITIVGELNDLTRWVSANAAPDTDLRHLAIDLPTLADVLRAGAIRAVERGEFFVAETPRLTRPARGILYATTTWRIARHDDTSVRQVQRMLHRVTSAEPTAPIDTLHERTAPQLAEFSFPTATRTTAVGSPQTDRTAHQSPPVGRRARVGESPSSPQRPLR
ncbi:hypothetical protein KZZ52_41720 [Dactylosporangium sp. AC04546]|uniref:hypothetical protein n=1 Tax=Dactylosporangium sp. AC04546 TaxID=2862460 RepID=UPI001EDE1E90|nr:hypothetical protein [Dactylosporangium sp. AC04546]WVK80445.1 hypothetical protein KZZ52_41720 [Dactylosporangium sp. AC04546]